VRTNTSAARRGRKSEEQGARAACARGGGGAAWACGRAVLYMARGLGKLPRARAGASQRVGCRGSVAVGGFWVWGGGVRASMAWLEPPWGSVVLARLDGSGWPAGGRRAAGGAHNRARPGEPDDRVYRAFFCFGQLQCYSRFTI
jgi:hypothetical protein